MGPVAVPQATLQDRWVNTKKVCLELRQHYNEKSKQYRIGTYILRWLTVFCGATAAFRDQIAAILPASLTPMPGHPSALFVILGVITAMLPLVQFSFTWAERYALATSLSARCFILYLERDGDWDPHASLDVQRTFLRAICKELSKIIEEGTSKGIKLPGNIQGMLDNL
jgi:hypothetical protein